MMNNLLRCLVVIPILAGLTGLTACMPGLEPTNSSTVNTGTSAVSNSSSNNSSNNSRSSTNASTNARANRTANTAAPAPTPAPTTATAPTTPTTPEEREAVSKLQWVHTADAASDAAAELAQAKAKSQKPVVMAFVRRGLSYPGLNRVQMAKIRRKVHDKIVEGSGDMIFGPTHRQLRQKLRAYAITYNQAILAAMQ